MNRMTPERQVACERCFEDPEFQDRFNASERRSTCCWCGARSVRVLPLDAFGADFREVVSQFYQSDNHGEFVDELLLSDWPRILDRRFQRKSPERRRSFLIAILEAGIARKEL